MLRGVMKKSSFLMAGGLFLVFCFSGVLQSETIAKGNVLGYIYGSDGTTPYEGAVLKVMNVTTGSVYESTKSNSSGVVELRGLETGFYEYAVSTADGTFVSEGTFGLRIREDKTEEMAVRVSAVKTKAV